MLQLACKCLNVHIKSRSKDLHWVNSDELELTPVERDDEFFQMTVYITSDLETIHKEQPGLISLRKVGSWRVYYCTNCSMYTHAIHKDFGIKKVLINKEIITEEEEIKRLNTSRDFSPVFRIIIDHDKVDELYPLQLPSKLSVSQLSNTIRSALTGLDQQLEEAIHLKATFIDEQIKAFTREQYQILEEFKERAHAEHAILTKLICTESPTVNIDNRRSSIQYTNNSISKTPTADSVDATANFASRNYVLPKEENEHLSNAHALNGKARKTQESVMTNSYEGDVFLLEGMEDNSVRDPPPFEAESDTDDSGNEGIQIPRRRSGHSTLARSLPVTVPTFHSYGQRRIMEDDDDDDDPASRDPVDPNNIRASIKALAKSVHGDTVFGDLPRPRFSTQI